LPLLLLLLLSSGPGLPCSDLGLGEVGSGI
jgi:hypothetical protein